MLTQVHRTQAERSHILCHNVTEMPSSPVLNSILLHSETLPAFFLPFLSSKHPPEWPANLW